MAKFAEGMRETSKDEWAQFQKWVHYYTCLFGFTAWKVECRFQELPTNSESHMSAAITYDIEARYATVSQNVQQMVKGEYDPRDDALHEMLHLVLAELEAYGVSRYITSHEIKRADEAAVVRLHNVISTLESKVPVPAAKKPPKKRKR